MDRKISISGIGSLSALGVDLDEVIQSYKDPAHRLSNQRIEGISSIVGPLTNSAQAMIDEIRRSNKLYRHLDQSVLAAILAARSCIKMSGWAPNQSFGINIGSSRGATELFEKYHQTFLESGQSSHLSSPTTTLGNISSWVSNDLNHEGPEISHSITCSTALHALLNGMAWIRSGMADKFIVGGSEAPLTPFTLSQMKALRIYSDGDSSYPCRSLDITKKENSMVLGEAASVACLELGISNHALAIVEDVGYATEPLEHGVSISSNAVCFQKSMQMALKHTDPADVDVIIMHAPGTIKGDLAEWNAIKETFNNRLPSITSNKWKIGHTLAASGMLSVEMAICMFRMNQFIINPLVEHQIAPENIRKVLVNAVGFGGNAVSILLSSPNLYLINNN